MQETKDCLAEKFRQKAAGQTPNVKYFHETKKSRNEESKHT